MRSSAHVSFSSARPARRPIAAPATRGLVVFELEGTLLSEADGALSSPAGADVQGQRMQLAAARIKQARSLRSQGVAARKAEFARAPLVPGAEQAIAQLQRSGVVCGLVSLGWEFGVEAVAQRLGVTHYLGAAWEPHGAVVHVWQEDQDEFRRRLALQLRLPLARSVLVRERVTFPKFAEDVLRRWG